MKKPTVKVQTIGSIGANFDLASHELPVNAFTAGKNFHCLDGKISPFNIGRFLTLPFIELSTISWALYNNQWDDNVYSWDNVPEPVLNYDAGNVLFVNTGEVRYYVMPCRYRVIAYDGTSWQDIALDANISVDESLWTSCAFGSLAVVNNPESWPAYFSIVNGTTLTPLDFSLRHTFKFLNYAFRVIKSHKNFLFALNLTENGTSYPTSYRWSHPADENGLPFTWDETDLSAIAGKASISGISGAILDGCSLNDYFVIYSENAINILEYVGGEFIWQRREVLRDIGILNTGCVVEYNGLNFLITNSDIVQFDGVNIKSLVKGRWLKKVKDLLSAPNGKKSKVYVDRAASEIWFCFTGDSAILKIAIVYNTQEDSLSLVDLPDDIISMTYGQILSSNFTWESTLGTWAASSRAWLEDSTIDEPYRLISVANKDCKLFDLHEPSNGFKGFTIERTNIVFEDQESVSTIIRMYPFIVGTSRVHIQLGSHRKLGDTPVWKPSVIFRPGIDRKIDVRTTGMLHAWRITSHDGLPFELSGMDIEFVPSGER